MCPRLVILAALAAPCALWVGAGPAVQSPADTPAEEYRALLEESRLAARTAALSDEERQVFVGRVYRLRNEIALKFLELAERHPQHPIAVDALIQALWQVNTTPWPVELVGQDVARVRAFALLRRDHVQSDRLGPLCQRISLGFCAEYESLLRAVLEQSPHEEVRAQACLGLARFLWNRRQRVGMLSESPQLGREFEDLFGEEYLARLHGQDGSEVVEEAEALFERAVEQFGAVDLAGIGVVGDLARAGLFELRHLGVGQEAPDIEGKDQHGRDFKLRDYRGKVVLLDFWSPY